MAVAGDVTEAEQLQELLSSAGIESELEPAVEHDPETLENLPLKVLVLEKGEVMEFGDPYDLVRKEGGMFRGMCEMSGDLDGLLKLAKKAFEGRRLVDDEA